MEPQTKYRLTRNQSELVVRITGDSQADLFANSATALFDVMANIDNVQIKERIPLEVEGTDRDDLMVNWMREHEYDSVEQLKGSLSHKNCPDPSAFERAQYMRAVGVHKPA